MEIGIDIGGSHIGVGLVDNGKIISKKEMDLIKKYSESEIEEIIITNVKKYIKEILFEKNLTIQEIEHIGIAVPRKSRK